MTHGRWTEKAASDPRLTVAARVGVLVLGVILAPGAGWMATQLIAQGNRLTALETQMSRVVPQPYSATDAARDFALRDQQITALVKTVDSLAAVVGIVQTIQTGRMPQFDDMRERMRRLEWRLFGDGGSAEGSPR